MEILLFGGTMEGRVLAERLANRGIKVTCSVATEYGRDLIQSADGLTVRTGRLDQREMEALMRDRPYFCVVDATHPYAAEVSHNIKGAAEQVSLPYRRLLRASEQAKNVLWADSAEAAAQFLDEKDGLILLTTGSKELAAFTAMKAYRERLWVRILPSMQSLQAALALGVPAKHIICMQGPFSKELNVAVLRQIGARYLVTKDSGKEGGFTEKAAAAAEAGAELLVISRPLQERGQSLEALFQLLCQEAGV